MFLLDCTDCTSGDRVSEENRTVFTHAPALQDARPQFIILVREKLDRADQAVDERTVDMVPFVFALAVGIITGLRAMIGAAAAAWAAYLGVLPVSGTWLAWLASPWAVGLVTVFALVELVTDQLPSTPSRKIPVQFGTRVLIGAIAGVAFGLAGRSALVGSALGAVGAVLGTLGGAAVRARLAASFRRDWPAALMEDTVAIAGAVLIILALR
jgi:uncharacterized membrane protein